MHNTDKEDRLKIGLTHGNADEFSYTVLAKVLSEQYLFESAMPFAYANTVILNNTAKKMFSNDNFCSEAKQLSDVKGKKVFVLESGEKPLSAIDNALSNLKTGGLKVLISLPFDTQNAGKENPDFKTTAHWIASQFGGSHPFRMILSEYWRISFLTSIKQENVLNKLTAEKIGERIRALYKSLQSDFNITAPKIAVLSMNMDMESKFMSDYDRMVLQPLTASFLEEGKAIFGPYSPSLFFDPQNEKTRYNFDAVLCMYKEQMEYADKYYSSVKNCAYIAGFPFINIEPLYVLGKDEDIAAKCLAQAFYYAVDIEKNRNMYAQLTANPLQICRIENDEHES